MKKTLAFSLAVILFTNAFGQRRNYDNRSYDNYMEKSRKLRTTGFVMLGAGLAAVGGGVVLIASGVNHENNTGYYDDNTLNSQEVIGAVLVYAGALSSLGSIPFFVISGVMHKKAMRASAFLDMEKVPSSKMTGIPLQPFPAVGLRINL